MKFKSTFTSMGIKFYVLFFAISVLWCTAARATVYINSAVTWSSSTAIYDDIVVQSGGSLYIQGTHGHIIGNLTIENGGILTMNTSFPHLSFENLIIEGGAQANCDEATIFAGGSIYVKPAGLLELESSFLYVDEAIYVEADYTNPGTTINGGKLIADETVFDANGQSWTGIEVWGINGTVAQTVKFAQANFQGCTIENANYGISNSRHIGDAIQNGAHGVFSGTTDAPGGKIYCTEVEFINNNNSVILRDFLNRPTGGRVIRDASQFILCSFICNNTLPPKQPSSASNNFMVLDDVYVARISGCTFTNTMGDDMPTGLNVNGGGFGVSAYCANSQSLLPYPLYSCGGTLTKSSFSGLRNALNATGNYAYATTQITDAVFTDNAVNINMVGHDNARILRNTITADYNTIYNDFGTNFVGIELRGCDGFKLEENDIDLSNWWGNIHSVGIALINCGANYNVAYKNKVEGVEYCYQSVGENRTPVTSPERTGLVFVCNEANDNVSDRYNIIDGQFGYPTWPTYSTTPTTGMARFQMRSVAGNPIIYSAGNLFDHASRSAWDVNHLYKLHSNTLSYYYNGAITREEPVYTNVSSKHSVASTLTCTSNDYYSSLGSATYGGFIVKTGDLADDIDAIIASPEIDTDDELELAGLLGQYRLELDQVIDVMSWRDTIIHKDTIIMALEQMDYLYEYKLMLARVYASDGDFDAAMNVIDDVLMNFSLETEEEDRIDNIRTVYELAKDLDDNDGDWSLVDPVLKADVGDIATDDDYKARYMAQYYMQIYEGAEYGHEFIWLDGSEEKPGRATGVAGVSSESDMIYPNPATDVLHVQQSEGNATLTITDITGKMVLSAELNTGVNSINVSTLVPGSYIADIGVDGKSIHNAKIVVK